MTKDKEQAVRLLVNRHSQAVQRSLITHLTKVIPVPALQRAMKSWRRQPEWESLEATVTKIMGVLHEPVTVTRAVNAKGKELDLVSLYDAGPRLGASGRTLYDLSVMHPGFPDPFIVTTVGKLWVFDDVASFVRVYRSADGWNLSRGKATQKEKEKEKET